MCKLLKYDKIHNYILGNDVFCPSCQLKITGECKSCEICERSVHTNQYCSSFSEQNILICIFCAKNTAAVERSACENWRGLGSKSQLKVRPRTSYLDANSELLFTNYSAKNKVQAVSVMKNGNFQHLKPVVVDGIHIVMTNTCGFDSIVQLLACAYCDSNGFQQYIETLNDLGSLIINLVKEGITKKTYRLRASFLDKQWQRQQHPQGIYAIDLGGNISDIIKKLNMPCCIKVLKCTLCTYQEEHFDPFIEVSSEGNSIANFENNINAVVQERPIRKKCSSCLCTGQVMKKIYVSATHVFLEPIDTSSKTLEIRCALDNIPKSIKIRNSVYNLRGAVAYEGPDCSLGHFIGYARRHNESWEQHDDRANKSTHCSPAKIVRIQLLLYTI